MAIAKVLRIGAHDAQSMATRSRVFERLGGGASGTPVGSKVAQNEDLQLDAVAIVREGDDDVAALGIG